MITDWELNDIPNTPEGMEYALRQGRGCTSAIAHDLGIDVVTLLEYMGTGMPKDLFKKFLRILPNYV